MSFLPSRDKSDVRACSTRLRWVGTNKYQNICFIVSIYITWPLGRFGCWNSLLLLVGMSCLYARDTSQLVECAKERWMWEKTCIPLDDVTGLSHRNLAYFILRQRKGVPCLVTITGLWVSFSLSSYVHFQPLSASPKRLSLAKAVTWLSLVRIQWVDDGMGNKGNTLKGEV